MANCCLASPGSIYSMTTPAQPSEAQLREGYPFYWKHAIIHLNPENFQMHSDGDHSVRTLIEEKIATLQAEVERFQKIASARGNLKYSRELELEEATALVELLTSAYHNRGNWKGHCSCGLCESLMKAFTSPSLAPLLERRRLEREVLDAAREQHIHGSDQHPDLTCSFCLAIVALNAQGKEKAGA